MTEAEQEQEANHFAMCLLMPEKLVARELTKIRRSGVVWKGNQTEVHELARRFMVSVPLMTKRLLDLKIPFDPM